MTNVKQCTKCHETKPLILFYRDKNKHDGRAVWCKACRDKANRERAAAAAELDKQRLKAILNPKDKTCKHCRGTGIRPSGRCHCLACMGTGERKAG